MSDVHLMGIVVKVPSSVTVAYTSLEYAHDFRSGQGSDSGPQWLQTGGKDTDGGGYSEIADCPNAGRFLAHRDTISLTCSNGTYTNYLFTFHVWKDSSQHDHVFATSGGQWNNLDLMAGGDTCGLQVYVTIETDAQFNPLDLMNSSLPTIRVDAWPKGANPKTGPLN